MCEARVLLFGGTTEGRLLCEEAARRGLPLDVCVAGDYGREVLTPRPGLRVLEGRLAEAQMEARIRAGAYRLVMDATHPFAVQVSENVRQACAATNTPLVRVLRAEHAEDAQNVCDAESAVAVRCAPDVEGTGNAPGAENGENAESAESAENGKNTESTESAESADNAESTADFETAENAEASKDSGRAENAGNAENAEKTKSAAPVQPQTSPAAAPPVLYVKTAQEACAVISRLPGRVLLTTGSKELACFAALPDCAQRLIVRVLPAEESIAQCRAAGIPRAHIIAMQGPFSLEMNCATLRQFACRVLVTKDSGAPGGTAEKLAAARCCGAAAVVIGRPAQGGGIPLAAAKERLVRAYEP